eukprot:Ihof_evm3s182 gene=Ihof_evmTU3s182
MIHTTLRHAVKRANKIIIIGGGVGGLTAANAIMQLKTIDVNVYEKCGDYERPTSANASLAISPNGHAVLDALGFGSIIEKVSAIITKRKVVYGINSDKRVDLDVAPSIELWKEKYGYPLISIKRSSFLKILSQPLIVAGKLHLSKRLVRLVDIDQGVQCFFSDGSIEVADLVIGADGVNSAVSKHLCGDLSIPPVYMRHNMFYGHITSLPQPGFEDNLLNEPNQLVVMQENNHRIYTMPCGPHERTWGLSYRTTEGPHLTGGSLLSTKGNVTNHLNSMFHDNKAIMELVSHTDPDQLYHFGLFSRAHKHAWYIDRVVLLGDACHATLPYAAQGANMAIEDGFVMAECLAAKQQNIDAALASFQYMQHNRTK